MKKKVVGRKFGRKKDQRKAFLRGLMRSLFLEEKITTTLPRAKEIRPLAEKMITKAKGDSFNTRRYLDRYFDKKTVKKLVEDLGKRYESRPGGYTRIIKLGKRKSDASPQAVIELVK